MRSYKNIVMMSLCAIILFFGGIMGYLSYLKQNQDQAYYLEMNHIMHDWQETGKLPSDLSRYHYIEDVTVLPLNDFKESRLEGNQHTIFWGIYNEAGQLEGFLNFTCKSQKEIILLKVVLISLSVVLLIVGSAFTYIYIKFIKPVKQMEELAEEMGRGNVSTVVAVLNQSHFEKLRWGLKMLQDELSTTTKKNLSLEKQRQTLVMSIAHGIKTPVSNIILYTSAIKEKLYPEEKFPEMITKIEENAQKIHQLLSDLLQTTAKPDCDMQIEKKEFYLDEWLKVIKLNYCETLALQHIDFKIESSSNCLLYSDPHALITVASNILDNAIKYGDGQYIYLQVEIEEEMLYVTIENSGLPIPKSEANAIFGSFYRGSNAENVQGNGLGLYICKKTIRKLDGSMFVLPKENSNQFVFAVPVKFNAV